MSAHGRAWECALALEDTPGLTPEQTIAVHVAILAGPDRASLELIALAVRVLGTRQ